MRELLKSPITAGVLTNAIYGFAVVAVKYFSITLERSHSQLKNILLAVLSVSIVGLNLVLYVFTADLFPLFSTILLAIAVFAYWKQLKQFWNVGLIGADRTI